MRDDNNGCTFYENGQQWRPKPKHVSNPKQEEPRLLCLGWPQAQLSTRPVHSSAVRTLVPECSRDNSKLRRCRCSGGHECLVVYECPVEGYTVEWLLCQQQRQGRREFGPRAIRRTGRRQRSIVPCRQYWPTHQKPQNPQKVSVSTSVSSYKRALYRLRFFCRIQAEQHSARQPGTATE